MDFQQGLISTVHDYSLGNLDAVAFNQELSQRPTTLLIPCLMEEFSRPALGLIRDTLSGLKGLNELVVALACLLYTSPSPRDRTRSRMPSSA